MSDTVAHFIGRARFKCAICNSTDCNECPIRKTYLNIVKTKTVGYVAKFAGVSRKHVTKQDLAELSKWISDNFALMPGDESADE